MTESKKDLRKRFLKERNILSKSSVIDLVQLKSNFLKLIQIAPILKNSIIGLYYPYRSEFDSTAILNFLDLKNLNINFSLPIVCEDTKDLVFRKWILGDELVENSFGIKEPKETQKNVFPNICIVPLVAFDDRGYRIGYGGGYYDRTLPILKKLNPKFFSIGLAYSFQQYKQIPEEETDARLDFILTEKKIFIISK